MSEQESNFGADMTSKGLLRRMVPSATLAVAYAVVLPTAAGWAGSQNLGPMSREQMAHEQQAIRLETDVLAQRVEVVVDQLAENKLIGSDAQSITMAGTVLRGVSEQEMAQVLGLLATSLEESKQSQNQEQVSQLQAQAAGKLRQLLLGYQFQQRVEELRNQAKTLAKAQQELANRIQHQTQEVQRGRNVDENWRRETADLQQRVGEQAAELEQAMRRIADLSQGQTQQQMRSASRELEQSEVAKTAGNIADQVRQNNYDQQARKAREVAEALDRVVDRLGQQQEQARELDFAGEQLEKMAKTQRDLSVQTRKNNGPDEQSAQAELQGMTEQVRDMSPDESRMKEQLGGAVWNMDRARDLMQKGQTEQAVRHQQSAAEHLTQAKQELDRMRQQQASRDAIAEAKKLLAQTREAREVLEQQRAQAEHGVDRSTPEARRQGEQAMRDVANQLHDAMRQSALQQPESVDELRDSRDHAHRAADQRGGDNAGDDLRMKTHLDQAIASAKQAEQIIQKNLKDLEQARHDLARLDDAREALQSAIQRQQHAASTNHQSQVSNQAQQQVTNLARQAAEKIGQVQEGEPSRQAQSAAEAARQQSQATESADPSTGDGERERRQASAMAELASALTQVDQMRSQLQQDLGKPTDAQEHGQARSDEQQTSSEEQAGVARPGRPQLDQARQNLTQAQHALEHGDTAKAEAALQQAARVMEQAMSSASQASQAQAVSDIGQAMMHTGQAQAQAASGHRQEAQEQVAAAQRALDQAQSAMASGSMRRSVSRASASAALQGESQANAPTGGGKLSRQTRNAMSRSMNRATARPEGALGPTDPVGGAEQSEQTDATGGGDDRAVSGERATDAAGLVRLPDRDRAALRQSAQQPYPPEYAELIEQYLKSLSTGETSSPN